MLKVIKGGVYATIQDLGRFGYRDSGVSVAGSMDRYSAKLANLLLGNQENDAVLEVTLGGARFQFLKDTIICIAGADLNADLNEKLVTCNHPVKVSANGVLSFSKAKYGVRTYVAVKGGFLNKPVLGSRSFFKEITKKYILKKDDEILYESYDTNKKLAFSSIKVNNEHFEATEIEVFKGPEYDLLNTTQKELLTTTEFTITSENSRMGYKLKETLANDLGSMLTSTVMVGTVQLTPSGTLIVLMRDCGVTGGYPRVLQLTDTAIDRLAQKYTNQQFRFKIVD